MPVTMMTRPRPICLRRWRARRPIDTRPPRRASDGASGTPTWCARSVNINRCAGSAADQMTQQAAATSEQLLARSGQQKAAANAIEKGQAEFPLKVAGLRLQFIER